MRLLRRWLDWAAWLNLQRPSQTWSLSKGETLLAASDVEKVYSGHRRYLLSTKNSRKIMNWKWGSRLLSCLGVERWTERKTERQAPEDVAQPDSRKTNPELRKEKTKNWIHKKTAKLLRVMSKENEMSKETKSTQPSENIPETTVRSNAQQKFPWHVECEVETTEKGAQ